MAKFQADDDSFQDVNFDASFYFDSSSNHSGPSFSLMDSWNSFNSNGPYSHNNMTAKKAKKKKNAKCSCTLR